MAEMTFSKLSTTLEYFDIPYEEGDLLDEKGYVLGYWIQVADKIIEFDEECKYLFTREA